MESLVTAAQMKEMDRLAIHDLSIPGLLLMEHAGLAVATRAIEMLEEIKGHQIAIFCGKGNNGGDGFVAARLLFGQGYQVILFLCGESRQIKGDARINLRSIKKLGLDIRHIKNIQDIGNLNRFDLIIDALLGTGITGEVTGLMAELIDLINQSEVSILAVDIPSGLNCDNGQFQGACIESDVTVTFGALKRGLVIPPGRELAGIVDVADIGIPEQTAAAVDIKTWLVDENDCMKRLPVRPSSAHKGDFGKVTVIAGSVGLTGAAMLCSIAALKAGCGMVTLGCPAGLNGILEKKLTEVMTRPLPQTEHGNLSLAGEPEIRRLLKWADVLAIGPGLSQFPETQTLIRKIILGCELPAVIDADGLNAFADHLDLLKTIKIPLILTPHPGELARLIHRDISDIERDPIEVVRQLAQEMNCVMVLKGAPTVIGSTDACVFVNNTGNSGMATAGSGDVLTGLIAGFLAQGCSPLDAAICGVYVHGLAGDLAAEADSDRSMIATDIIDHIGPAFRQIEYKS